MKFMAFVDLHGRKTSLEILKNKIKLDCPDFLVCAGDFTTFEHEIKKIMHDMSKLDGKIFLVHGNHEDEPTIRSISKIYPKIEFAHKKIIEHNDLIVIGWGGGG